MNMLPTQLRPLICALLALVLLSASAACTPASPQSGAAGTADFRPAGSPASLGPTTGAPKSLQQPAQPEEGGQLAPDFSIQTIDGEPFRLAEQRGKVVGVLFMASWCLSCASETQAWGKLQREYGERGLEVLIVSADPDDTPEDLERFRQMAQGPQRHWAIDRDSRALVLPYQVRTLGTTLIIDRQGRLAYRDDSPTPYDRLKRELEKVL